MSRPPGTSAKRRSVGSFAADKDEDGLEDTPDPFLAYRSFQQFKDSQGGGYSAVSSAGTDRAKSKLSSDHQSVKKLSESFASSKLSDYSSYTSGLHDSSLDSFDYKFSSAKLSESRSRPLEGGVFTSTPKYSDLSSNSGYLSR